MSSAQATFGGLSAKQADELVAAVEEARRKGNAEYTVHGWLIKAKRRSNLPRCDIELRDPFKSVTLYSIISLKRHLGLEGGGEPTAKRAKRTGGGSGAGGSADAGAEGGDEGNGPEDVWVACDACGKWRKLPGDTGPLPTMWFCHLHPDPLMASCAVAEQSYDDDGGVAWEYDGGGDLDGLGEAEDEMEDDGIDAAAAAAEAAAAEEMAAAAAAKAPCRGGRKGKKREEEPDEWLVALQKELQIKEPLTYIAAANDLLNSPQVSRRPCAHTPCPSRLLSLRRACPLPLPPLSFDAAHVMPALTCRSALRRCARRMT